LERKRLYEPGELVSTLTGELGLVLSEEDLKQVRTLFREGNRPGRFFAPGCCQKPDYVIQVPVLFKDKTYDVMRAMNLRKRKDVSKAERDGLTSLTNAGVENEEPV
jgi:hypothetical protein